jgi:L-threonylcarbamoyladenylate synthase
MTQPHVPYLVLQQAVAALRAGEVVAFPTETVYGLGADASNPQAVQKIYQLKGRPSSHPLIVHIGDITELPQWAAHISPAAVSLASAFWPGPLTLVLTRDQSVNKTVTGGQETVAVRVPSHPVAQQLLKAFGGGIAAPSANRFGHVSPTRAEHVREEFGDEVGIVLDGEGCEIGLESTIVSCVGAVPQLLRPGAITLSQLQAVVPQVTATVDANAPRAPGMLERHYSPHTPLKLVSTSELVAAIAEATLAGKQVAVLATHAASTTRALVTWMDAGTNSMLYARNLYRNIRALDKVGARVILVEAVPDSEAWAAVRDRLRRAATPA